MAFELIPFIKSTSDDSRFSDALDFFGDVAKGTAQDVVSGICGTAGDLIEGCTHVAKGEFGKAGRIAARRASGVVAGAVNVVESSVGLAASGADALLHDRDFLTEKNKARMAISFILTIALLGIPFYGHGASSIIIGILVIAALGLYLAPSVQAKIKEKWRISARTMNTAMLCTMMIVIGYSSYALIVIRSTANTPMDQNSPEDIFTLGEYLGREQYGTRPLFYGPAFSSKVALDVKDGYCIPRQSETGSKYVRKEKTSPDEKDSYIELPGRIEYEYAQNMLFPRMYSSSHAQLYKQWVDVKGHDVPYDQCGEMVMVNMPTQWENIKFFFTYQLNFMYWRYFMWNFAGRQNDIQGSGEIEHGNWITGIPFIDNLLVGNQELLPQDLKNNKGHNVFYCLPLILGLIGLFWQAYRNNLEVILLEEENLIAAKENYEIAMERYLLGDLPGIEMREAQKSLLDAEERILTAQYNTKLCEISLQQISGNVMVYLE